MTIPGRVLRCVGVALAAGAVAVFSDDDAPAVGGPELPHFHDMADAPSVIQEAARAVVRLCTAGQCGSGSFISATGLLLTNDHVLGTTVCPVEGCYAQIAQMHQLGHTRLAPITVFAVPEAVDAGLDMAAVQLWTGPGGTRLESPDYLQLNSKDSSALLGTHVTIVGHPKSGLKKWTDGFAADAMGKWFLSTAYMLPGESGAPVLDDDGQLVGLIHRLPTSEDLFTDEGANIYSIGTCSADLGAALTSPSVSGLLSASAATTAADFVKYNRAYRNARVGAVDMEGTTTSPLALLGGACDVALARTDFDSPDDMTSALAPCYDAHLWIECRADSGAPPSGALCPAADELPQWVLRNQSVNRLWQNLNGTFDYAAVSSDVAALQPTQADGMIAGAQSLLEVIDAANPPLNFTLANYLAAFGIDSYGGEDVLDYIVNYTRVPHHELWAVSIAYGATWLWGNGRMSKADAVSLMSTLLHDPNVSVGAKLAIEEWLYNNADVL